MDNRQANINRFEAEMAKVTRDGVDKLMAFIRKSDMYAAPASTRFHLSVTGGLLQHSLNVLDALRANLTKNDDGTYSYETARSMESGSSTKHSQWMTKSHTDTEKSQ